MDDSGDRSGSGFGRRRGAIRPRRRAFGGIDAAQPAAEALRFLERRGAVIDPGARVRIGAVGEQQLDPLEVVVRGGVVQRRPVVDPARADVGTELEQQCDDLVALRPVAGERGDQRWKPAWSW
jgi:hypothetical protein